MARKAWKPNSLRWEIASQFAGAHDLARQLHSSPLVAQILANRGVSDLQTASEFLDPKMSHLHDPEILAGCVTAAKRIKSAIDSGEKIVIYGDYDVDGMTSTAILHSCLKMVGASAEFYVPHRLDEGYGLSLAALEKIIDRGANLIITVDCGITAFDEVEFANSKGVDIIITDHHQLQDQVPNAYTLVHPLVENSQGELYPNPNICGAGVAFKLAWQLAREVCGSQRVDDKMRAFLLDATCLAALGTIADVVELIGENRAIARFGLLGLPHSKHIGLSAMLHSANLTEKQVNSFDVGFVLAPRLNAAGRMGHARLAVELLTTDCSERALEIAEYLKAQNTQRQKVERAITAEAVEMVQNEGLDQNHTKAIVLGSEDWHGGVIGIVASRLVDRFHRPTILFAFNDEGIGHGSGRSIQGFNIAAAMQKCSKKLISFGGHKMAGGCRVDRADLDQFAAEFGQYASENVPKENLIPPLDIDAQVDIYELDGNLAGQLDKLGPHGQGNRPPVVAVKNCQIIGAPKRIGKTGTHVSMLLSQGQNRIRVVGFGMGDLADMLLGVSNIDIAGEPMVNNFRGQTTVEIKLIDVKWDA